jgi:import inner membrane translocase subunit TIM50
MLARAVRTGLRAPAIRTPSANFRIAPAPQWTRSFADHKRPNNKGSSRAQSDNAKFSKSQEEFNTKASPSENVTPKNEAGEAAEPFQGGPLPDLTQGIPSTIEYELYGKKAAQGGPATGLNLTQDPNQEPGPGTGGRPRGELPESAYISSGEKKRLRVANYMYGAFFASCIVGFGYLGRNWETEEEERQHQETAPSGWSPALMWKRARARTGDQLNYYNEPAFKKLLPDPDPSFERPYTLILSLEDLLIHSEWSRDHGWRMAKRPGVDYFLRYLSQYYELVIFTTVPWAVGEPVIRKLDPYHIVTWPLYREATMYRNGEYVKV